MGVAWISLYFVDRTAYLRFHPSDWKPRWQVWADMLKIGLPAGTEFALMGVYLAVVYSVSRPFGAASQAGFGIGLRILQSGFLPVVALGFAVAPVAGQNFAARRPDRVREVFRSAVWMAVVAMFCFSVLVQLEAATLVRTFSSDPTVIAVGADYLRIVTLASVASGVTFVSASMFQAMGNTIPSLVTSLIRMAVVVIPTVLLSHRAGFDLHWIWYLTVASVTMQMALNLLLLQREFRVRMT